MRFARFLLLPAMGLVMAGCRPAPPPEPAPRDKETDKETAKATPTPSPTPIYIPRQKMEVARLYNGARVKTTFESQPGASATTERLTPESYTVEVTVKVNVPRASQDLTALSTLNPALPTLLPGLGPLLESAVVSPHYEELYRRKLARMERNLPRLEALLSRHDFFDCETILHLQDPQSGRAAVLVQADMDVDTDGSDGDRIPNPEGKDMYFQPMTSYHWPKQTEHPNPFLERSLAKLRAAREEAANTKGLSAAQVQELRNKVGAARYEVNQLTQRSFLLSETDPYIVIPGFMASGNDPVYTPKWGDYAAVIYEGTIYPAIVGDAGPTFKAGEASLRLSKQLNPRSTAYSRPVSSLKVTYLIFPNTAEETPQPPNLDRWRERVAGLLGEIGGHGGTLFAWETTAQPVPTPTPTPEPTPTPAPSPTPGPSATPDPSASPEPLPSATSSTPETPTPAPSVTP